MGTISDELASLKNSVKELVNIWSDGIRNIYKAAQGEHRAEHDAHRSQEKNAISPVAIKVVEGVEIYKSPSDKKNETEHQQRTLRWQKYTFWAVVIYAGITLLIWRANKKAADAAKSSADTAARELELSERPWIDATIEIGGPITFDVNGARIELNFFLRNSGHSPAIGVFIYPITLIGKQIQNINAERSHACQEAERILRGSGSNTMMSIFPNAPLIKQPMVTYIYKAQIEDEKPSKIWPSSHFGNVMLSPTVIACIAYRPSFNLTSIYHTSYTLDLRRLDSSNNQSVLFEIGQNVQLDRLRLFIDPLGGLLAD